jgi:hypothetical protein
MFLKIGVLVLILMSFTCSVQAQTVTIPIVYNSGTGADSIMIQTADDSLFTINIISSGWEATTPNKIDTCDCSFPSNIASKVYWHRGRTKNTVGTSVWSIPWSFTLKITQVPSGCTPIYPLNKAVITK